MYSFQHPKYILNIETFSDVSDATLNKKVQRIPKVISSQNEVVTLLREDGEITCLEAFPPSRDCASGSRDVGVDLVN